MIKSVTYTLLFQSKSNKEIQSSVTFLFWLGERADWANKKFDLWLHFKEKQFYCFQAH